MGENSAPADTAQFFLSAFKKFVRHPVADLRILDLGCGQGALVEKLCALGLDAEGCDFSNQLGSAERLHPIEEPYRLPFVDEAFDLVVSTSVLEHIVGDLEVCFREVARVLRPGGAAMHIYPGKWYLPTEPHIYVPLVNWFWPRVPRWWLALWALLGIRNEFQGSSPWRDVVAQNERYCREGLSYYTTRRYRDLSRRTFRRVFWPMDFYIENADGGVARLGRLIRARSIVGLLSREIRMAFLIQIRAGRPASPEGSEHTRAFDGSSAKG